jgi:hypothetical protein
MKIFTLAFLFASSSTFAQAIELSDIESLMTSQQTVLENVSVGMTKNIVSTGTIDVNGADCKFTQTQLQSIMRIDGAKMIVFSQESFVPESSTACTAGEFKAYKENVLFNENKPTLSASVSALNALDIVSIAQSGNLVSILINDKIGENKSEQVTLKYDLSKSTFRNELSTSGSNYEVTTSDSANIDVNAVDLSDVLFCASKESNKNDCMRGNFSDILF